MVQQVAGPRTHVRIHRVWAMPRAPARSWPLGRVDSPQGVLAGVPRRARDILRYGLASRDLVILGYRVVPLFLMPSMPLRVACLVHGTDRMCEHSIHSGMASHRGRAALLFVRRYSNGGILSCLGCVRPLARV